MFLVQLYIPLASAHQPGARSADLERLQAELTREFGGVTAFVSQPAAGLWKSSPDEVVRDSVVLFEVMVDQLDREWWAAWREDVEHRLGQEDLAIRAIECA